MGFSDIFNSIKNATKDLISGNKGSSKYEQESDEFDKKYKRTLARYITTEQECALALRSAKNSKAEGLKKEAHQLFSEAEYYKNRDEMQDACKRIRTAYDRIQKCHDVIYGPKEVAKNISNEVTKILDTHKPKDDAPKGRKPNLPKFSMSASMVAHDDGQAEKGSSNKGILADGRITATSLYEEYKGEDKTTWEQKKRNDFDYHTLSDVDSIRLVRNFVSQQVNLNVKDYSDRDIFNIAMNLQSKEWIAVCEDKTLTDFQLAAKCCAVCG